MVTYFNKKDMISFGNYLLSEKRKERFELTEKIGKEQGMNPLPAEESMKMVHDADIANWIDENKQRD